MQKITIRGTFNIRGKTLDKTMPAQFKILPKKSIPYRKSHFVPVEKSASAPPSTQKNCSPLL